MHHLKFVMYRYVLFCQANVGMLISVLLIIERLATPFNCNLLTLFFKGNIYIEIKVMGEQLKGK